MRIGWIGLGRMGTPMARRLAETGAELTLCDTDRDRTTGFPNATTATTPAETARDADIVFSSIPDDAALLAITEGEHGLASALQPGQVFVEMSTVSPQASARVAAALRPGVLYLRCPVSGSTATAEAGTLTLFCSGPQEAIARAAPLLDRLGSKRLHFGPAEEARVIKLLVNMVVVITPAVLGEALAFGARHGLDWTSMVDALAGSVVASPLLAYKTEMLKSRDWRAAASVDLVAKDLDLALDAGRGAVPMPLTALVRQFAAALQAAGEGDLDFFRLATWPERIARGD